MKKMNSFLTLALASALSITVLAGCGTGAQQGGDNKQAASGTDSAAGGAKPKMVMATSADYPPYEFHDTSSGKDEIVGFDIDIANYLSLIHI